MKKLVIYFGGGTMKGVFGAGVATALEDAHLYSRIEAVYGASAGSLIGAYFLAQQTRVGSSIYWEDLTRRFLSRTGFFLGIAQRLVDEFVFSLKNRHYFHKALDLEYLMDVIQHTKPLDVSRIENRDIPLFIKVINLHTLRVEYLRASGSTFMDTLKAGVSVLPYVNHGTHVRDFEYMDAAIPDIIGFRDLRAHHPDAHIIIILNSPLTHRTFRNYRLKNIIEGKFMQWMFRDARFYDMFARAEDRFQDDVSRVAHDSAVTLIAPPDDSLLSARMSTPEKLKQGWELGHTAGMHALAKITAQTS